MGPEGSTEMMGFEDYKEQVTADALEAIREGAGWCVTWDEMLDELHIDDAVTGGGSGSYKFCAATSLENVRGLLGDEAFAAEAAGMGCGAEVFALEPEALDVLARCLALDAVSGELESAYDEARIASA